MIKVKNVRAGIVIIADAGLKLAPGETVSVEKLTPQMGAAEDAGLLARMDNEPDTRPKTKTAARGAENRKHAGSEAKLDQSPASDANPEEQSFETAQGQLVEVDNASS